MKQTTGYLTREDFVVRTVLEDSQLRWESDTPRNAELAQLLVPIEDIPESGGNPSAWALKELKSHLGGETLVIPVD